MYKIILTGLNTDRKIKAIKALRTIWPTVNSGKILGLREAKIDMHDRVRDGHEAEFTFTSSETEANAVAAYLTAFGWVVRVDEPQVTLPASLVQEIRFALQDHGSWGLADNLYRRLYP